MQYQSNVNNQDNEIRSVKFTYNEDIRRFTMKPETTFTEMVNVVRSLIHVDDTTPLVFKYLDDENEWVTVEKEIEFQTALSIAGNPIKFAVSLFTESEKKQWKGRRGGQGKCRRGGKFKGRGGKCKGRKFAKKLDVDETESLTSETSERKFKGKGRGRKHWKKFRDERESETETVATVDPTLTSEEIKSKIDGLVQHKTTVLEQLKSARDVLVAKRLSIKECRQVPEKREEIPALRLTLIEAKSAVIAVRDELCATKFECRCVDSWCQTCQGF
jgi:hypothetical protein